MDGTTCPFKEYNIWGPPLLDINSVFDDSSGSSESSDSELLLPFTYNHESRRKRPQRKQLTLVGSPFNHGCLCGHGTVLRPHVVTEYNIADQWTPRLPAIKLGYRT